MTEPSADVLKERERCQRIAEAVMTSSKTWLDAGAWSLTDRAAWEARARAASDILTVIRSGTEP